MFIAELHDPIHGHFEASADTDEEAVELAFREMSASWCEEGYIQREIANGREFFFDGEIRGTEVWWENRGSCQIGNVYEVKSDDENVVVGYVERYLYNALRCGGEHIMPIDFGDGPVEAIVEFRYNTECPAGKSQGLQVQVHIPDEGDGKSFDFTIKAV